MKAVSVDSSSYRNTPRVSDAGDCISDTLPVFVISPRLEDSFHSQENQSATKKCTAITMSEMHQVSKQAR
jgi:hypothetical protein